MQPNVKIKTLTTNLRHSDFASHETVLCYGHFNVIHPGHLRFLEYAKTLGSYCSVFLIEDDRLSQEIRDICFPIQQRAKTLAAIQMVDEVLIPSGMELANAVKLIKPSILLLGREQESGSDAEILSAIIEQKKLGGKVHFHAGDTKFSPSILKKEQGEALDEGLRQRFLRACERQDVSKSKMIGLIERFKEKNVLVIGDTIVDQFVACDALGMSAEAPIIVVRELEADQYIGGAAIVAGHLRALGAKCQFISVLGEDQVGDWIEKELESQGIDCSLLRDSSRPTTFKIRYLVDKQKMFRVSRLKDHDISLSAENLIRKKIQECAGNIDAIVLSDFVYGVITQDLIEFVKTFASKAGIPVFADIQCSSQVGNVLKFRNFDTLFPTEREARIAIGNQGGGLEWIANQIISQTSVKRLLLKLGSEGFVTYDTYRNGYIKREHFPALISNPVDVAGAGDSLLAAFVLSLIVKDDAMLASSVGAIVASISVSQFGNKPIANHSLVERIEKVWA